VWTSIFLSWHKGRKILDPHLSGNKPVGGHFFVPISQQCFSKMAAGTTYLPTGD